MHLSAQAMLLLDHDDALQPQVKRYFVGNAVSKH